jgi:hypothetical protein
MLSRFVVALSITGLFAAGCAQGGAVDASEGDEGAGGTTGAGGTQGTGGATSKGGGGHGGATTTGGGGATGSGGATGGGGAQGTGGSGGTTTTTGAGGAQGTGGSGGATTTTTTGAGGAAPDAGPVCSEQPCKLVAPQCGCAQGKACVLTGAGTRTCNLAGAVTWGGECNNVSRCEPGLGCVNTGATATCYKFCDSDKMCTAPGGLCIVTLVDQNQNEIPNAKLCTPNCSPITNTGCPVAGTSCQIGQEQAGAQRFFTTCEGAGAGTQGASCTKDADCAPTYGCFTNAAQQQRCMRWCDASKQACPGGLTCAPLSDGLGNDVTVGAVTYGVCQ